MEVTETLKKSFLSRFTLYVDLDGVLVDFDRGVQQVCGALPDHLEPRHMWPRLARFPGFYEHLDWMPDGHDLWEAVLPFSPVILTGLPMGTWAEAQKRAWCAREIGAEIPVITCMSRDKHLAARSLLRPGTIPILMDDRLSLCEAWESQGGIFIHHRHTAASLEKFQAIIQEK